MNTSIKYIFLLSCFLITITLSASYAGTIDESELNVEKERIEDNIKRYLPGLLLTSSERSSSIGVVDTSPIPSSKYRANNLPIEELQQLYRNGEYRECFSGILQAARVGNIWAQETIGIMYKNGHGTEANTKKSIRWLERAAEKQRPLAQHYLGVIYYKGDGIYKDFVKASMYLSLAIINYTNGSYKDRAILDRNNVHIRLSDGEKRRSQRLVKKYLELFKTESSLQEASTTEDEEGAEPKTP